ncbi:hypothetical protein ACLOJK_034038 [Asimina triloba]
MAGDVETSLSLPPSLPPSLARDPSLPLHLPRSTLLQRSRSWPSPAAFDVSRLAAPSIVSLNLEQSPAHLGQVRLPSSRFSVSIISPPSSPSSLPRLSPLPPSFLPRRLPLPPSSLPHTKFIPIVEKLFRDEKKQRENREEQLRLSCRCMIGIATAIPPPFFPKHHCLSRSAPQIQESFFWATLFLKAATGYSLYLQPTIPLGTHDKYPVSVSFIARHGGDRFLLDMVQTMYASLQEHVDIVAKSNLSNNASSEEESAEIAKEKVKCHSVIVATGAIAKRLRLPREDEFWSIGISACAICDGGEDLQEKHPGLRTKENGRT